MGPKLVGLSHSKLALFRSGSFPPEAVRKYFCYSGPPEATRTRKKGITTFDIFEKQIRVIFPTVLENERMNLDSPYSVQAE